MDKRKDGGNAVIDAGKVLSKNRRIMDDLIMTEGLKSALIQNRIFENNTIQELFMVSWPRVKCGWGCRTCKMWMLMRIVTLVLKC